MLPVWFARCVLRCVRLACCAATLAMLARDTQAAFAVVAVPSAIPFLVELTASRDVKCCAAAASALMNLAAHTSAILRRPSVVHYNYSQFQSVN